MSTQAVACHRCGFGFLFELLDDYYPGPNTGFVTCDKEGRVLASGRGVFELTGFAERDLIGRDVVEALGLSGFEADKNPVALALEWGVRRLGRGHRPAHPRRRRSSRSSRTSSRPTTRTAGSSSPSLRGSTADAKRAGQRPPSARVGDVLERDVLRQRGRPVTSPDRGVVRSDGRRRRLRAADAEAVAQIPLSFSGVCGPEVRLPGLRGSCDLVDDVHVPWSASAVTTAVHTSSKTAAWAVRDAVTFCERLDLLLQHRHVLRHGVQLRSAGSSPQASAPGCAHRQSRSRRAPPRG